MKARERTRRVWKEEKRGEEMEKEILEDRGRGKAEEDEKGRRAES